MWPSVGAWPGVEAAAADAAGRGAAALDAAGLQLFFLGFWLLESVQARKNSMAVLGASWAGH